MDCDVRTYVRTSTSRRNFDESPDGGRCQPVTRIEVLAKRTYGRRRISNRSGINLATKSAAREPSSAFTSPRVNAEVTSARASGRATFRTVAPDSDTPICIETHHVARIKTKKKVFA